MSKQKVGGLNYLALVSHFHTLDKWLYQAKWDGWPPLILSMLIPIPDHHP
jgi:hypothetical protein